MVATSRQSQLSNWATYVISLWKHDLCVYEKAGNQLYTQRTFRKPTLVF